MNNSEKYSKLISVLVQIIIFIICMAMITLGHSYGRVHVDVKGGLISTGIMLVGLAGILGIMYFYNKKFK